MKHTVADARGHSRHAADAFKPTDQAGLRQAARELHTRGLTDQDVAQTLGLNVQVVKQLLGELGEPK